MKREVNWCLVERVCVRQTDGAETRPCVRDLGTVERRTEVDGYPEWGREGAEAHGRRDK